MPAADHDVATLAHDLNEFGFVIIRSLFPLSYANQLRDRAQAVLVEQHGAGALDEPGAELSSDGSVCVGDGRELFHPLLHPWGV